MRKHLFRNLLLGLVPAIAFLLPVSAWAASNSHTTEDFANVVVFACLSSEEAADDQAFFEDPSNTAKLIELYDGDYGRSVTNYMASISYGQLALHNIFPQYNEESGSIEPYMLTVTKEAANASDVDAQIITEIINNNPDLSQYVTDYDGDGCIDNLTVILRGGAYAESADSSLYPHKSEYAGADGISGKLVRNYNMICSWRLMEQPVLSEESGTLSHELLHSLGFADLYNSSSENPVYTWSIMGSASYYLQYPLAYERMYFKDWISIDEISEDATLTLNPQDDASGNQAYILKSELSDTEFFVVEYRRRNDSYDVNTLDAKVGNSAENQAGLIVYRVNTAASDYGNRVQPDWIYIFRPQPGQIGYDEQYSSISCLNACLSAESGRTVIGSADMSAGLEDGALTFSDGSNSGIVISTASDGDASAMEFTVTFPDTTDYDLWENTGFPDTACESWENKTSAIGSFGDVPYVAVSCSGSLKVYSYMNETWSQVGSALSCSTSMYCMRFFDCGGSLYLAYGDSSGTIKAVRLDEGEWTQTDSLSSYQEFDICESGDKAYIAYIDPDGNVCLACFDGKAFGSLDAVSENNYMAGQPKCTVLNGVPYIAYRDANGDRVVLAAYLDGTFRDCSGDVCGNPYGLIPLNGRIYVPAVSGGSLCMYTYSTDGWTAGSPCSGVDALEMQFVSSGGNLYYLYTPNTDGGYTQVCKYDAVSDTFSREGENVGPHGTSASLVNIDGEIYVTYVNNGTVSVKKKSLAADQTLSELLKLQGLSLSVLEDGAGLGLNYYLMYPQEYSTDGIVVRMTVDGELTDTLLSELAAVDSTVKNDVTYSVYKFTGYVNAAQMTDKVKLEVIENDTTIFSRDYSPAYYARTLLEMYESENEIANETASETTSETGNASGAGGDTLTEAQAVFVKAMLTYGSAAQCYFVYDTENLADPAYMAAGFTELERADLASYETEVDLSGLSGISYCGASLRLGSLTYPRFYFRLSDGKTAADFSCYLEMDAADGTAARTPLNWVQKGSLIYIESAGMAPGQMDQRIDIVVENSGKASDTEGRIRFCIYDYFAACLRATDESAADSGVTTEAGTDTGEAGTATDLPALMAAMYRYQEAFGEVSS